MHSGLGFSYTLFGYHWIRKGSRVLRVQLYTGGRVFSCTPGTSDTGGFSCTPGSTGYWRVLLYSGCYWIRTGGSDYLIVRVLLDTTGLRYSFTLVPIRY